MCKLLTHTHVNILACCLTQGLPHDQSSDIFSLGITFLELITGQDPKYDNSSVGVCSLGAPDTGFLPESISEVCVGVCLCVGHVCVCVFVAKVR